ncbi:MAG: hypothetical protein ACW976_03295 [Candidatus Ranarchaeia archaeon]|jgi:hypothetical protein
MFKDGTSNSDEMRLLAEEFEKTYGDLEEKARRVRISDAEKVGLAYPDAPIELRRVAVQISSDTLMDSETAFNYLLKEYNRLSAIGHAVPPIPTFEFDFAVREGRWIEFLYNRFARHIENTTREIANLENVLRGTNVENIPIEKVIELISLRKKVRENYIVPLMERWVEEHKGSSHLESVAVFGSSLLRINYEDALPYIEDAKKELLDIVEFLLLVIQGERESRAVEIARNELKESHSYLKNPIDDANLNTLADLLVQIAPSQTIEQGESKFLLKHTPFPSSVLLGPVLSEPIDFLERDIKLVKRLPTNEGDERLKRSISGSLRASITEEKSDVQATAEMIHEVEKRFNLDVESLEVILERLGKETKGLMGVDRVEKLRGVLYNFIRSKILIQKA